MNEPATSAVAESESIAETPVLKTWQVRASPASLTVCSAAGTFSSKSAANLGVITSSTSLRYSGMVSPSSRSGP